MPIKLAVTNGVNLPQTNMSTWLLSPNPTVTWVYSETILLHRDIVACVVHLCGPRLCHMEGSVTSPIPWGTLWNLDMSGMALSQDRNRVFPANSRTVPQHIFVGTGSYWASLVPLRPQRAPLVRGGSPVDYTPAGLCPKTSSSSGKQGVHHIKRNNPVFT